MRVLFATKGLPGPVVDGYAIRNRGLLGRIVEIGEVDLVSYDEGELPPELAERVGRLHRVPHDRTRRSSLPERARFAMSGRGLYHHESGFVDALREAAADAERAGRPYDVVWLTSWALLHYAGAARAAFPDTPIVADLADDEVRAREIERDKATSPVARLRLWRDVVRHRDLEREAFPHLDAVVYVSEADSDAARRRHPSARIETRPNGVDTELFRPAEHRVDEPVVVFEGTMDFAPNVEGALHLGRNIFPLVQREIPDARLVLVGRSPVPEVRALASDAVDVTGTVDDVRAHVQRGAVFACPLLGGVGQKNKVLQAWALGVPVVATPISVEGLEVRVGRNLVLADDPRPFARAVVDLLRDPERRDALARAGRETALEHYSVATRMDQFESLLRDVAAHPRGAAGADRARRAGAIA